MTVSTINISKLDVISFNAFYIPLDLRMQIDNATKILRITGIKITPEFIEIKPNYYRDKIISKIDSGKSEKQINQEISKGQYLLNISDYTDSEIKFLFEKITDNWLSEIWEILISVNEQAWELSLTNEAVINRIIEKNQQLFKTNEEFVEFCNKAKLKIEDFIIPAKYPKLDIKLKEISARLEIEQFYARRFLLMSLISKKIKNRIKEYTKHNKIDSRRHLTLKDWLAVIESDCRVLEKYKDFNKLYDMTKGSKINVENSSNVSIVNGNIDNSKITLKTTGKKGVFDKRVAIWTLILAGLTILTSVLIYWDEIKKLF